MLEYAILFFCTGILFLFIGFLKIFQSNMIYLLLFRILTALFFFISLSIAYLPTYSISTANMIITNTSTNSIISYVNSTTSASTTLSDPTSLVFADTGFLMFIATIGLSLIEVVLRLGYLK